MIRRLALVAGLLLGCGGEGDEGVGEQSAAIEPPDCTGCAWGYEICLEVARAETIDEIRRGLCLLPVCLVWHRERRVACEVSYARCVKGCR